MLDDVVEEGGEILEGWEINGRAVLDLLYMSVGMEMVGADVILGMSADSAAV